MSFTTLARNQYSTLRKGDEVEVYGYLPRNPDKVTYETFTVLKVYAGADESMGGPFIVDMEGDFHFLKDIKGIRVVSYFGGVPNAHHIFWLSDTAGGHDVRYNYAHRTGHPENRVWENEGESYSQEELLTLVGGQRIFPLDERYTP